MFSSRYEPAGFGILVPFFPGPEKWRSFGPCMVFTLSRWDAVKEGIRVTGFLCTRFIFSRMQGWPLE